MHVSPNPFNFPKENEILQDIYLISMSSPDTISLPPLLLSRMNFPRSLLAGLGKARRGVLGRNPGRAPLVLLDFDCQWHSGKADPLSASRVFLIGSFTQRVPLRHWVHLFVILFSPPLVQANTQLPHQEWPQPSTSLSPHGHPFDECSPTLIYHPQIGPNELNTALLNITRFKWIFSLQVCPIIGFIHLVEVRFTLANITPIQAPFSAPVTGAGQICHRIITGNSNNN